MTFKFEFKLIDTEKETEFKAGDKIRLHLANGEIVVGELQYSDGILLSIERKECSEEYDFWDIENIEHISNISKHDENEIYSLINWKDEFTKMIRSSGLNVQND